MLTDSSVTHNFLRHTRFNFAKLVVDDLLDELHLCLGLGALNAVQ